jgi:hypothetical protein
MIIEDEQQKQPPSPTIETLQQKIDEFANGIVGLYGIYRDRKKTIKEQLQEIRQLAEDLSIDDMQLRHMISECFYYDGRISIVAEEAATWISEINKAYKKGLSRATAPTRPATTTATAATTKGISRVTIIIISTFSIRTTATTRGRNIHSTRISSTIG